MPGTVAGGRKAALTNKIRHGKNFYAEIGRKGGRNGHLGGFAANPELAKIAGAKGGLASRRGNSYTNRWFVMKDGKELFKTPRKTDAMEYIRKKNLYGVEIVDNLVAQQFIETN